MPILAASCLALGGCAASIAAGAVGAAVRAATPERPIVTESLREPSVAACSARAAPHGQIHIIDADQRPDGRVTVWGTVENGERRSFECRYSNGEVKAFRLRPIRQRQAPSTASQRS